LSREVCFAFRGLAVRDQNPYRAVGSYDPDAYLLVGRSDFDWLAQLGTEAKLARVLVDASGRLFCLCHRRGFVFLQSAGSMFAGAVYYMRHRLKRILNAMRRSSPPAGNTEAGENQRARVAAGKRSIYLL
jgi:hypothetical protein